jgi:hypothetical protein
MLPKRLLHHTHAISHRKDAGNVVFGEQQNHEYLLRYRRTACRFSSIRYGGAMGGVYSVSHFAANQ